MRASLLLLGLATVGTLIARASIAQTTVTATQSVTANIGQRAVLTISGPVTFTDENEVGDVAGAIAASPVTVSASVRCGPTTNWTIAVSATGDLTTGGASPSTIPISNVKWTASGAGFTAGPNTMVNTPSTASVASFTGPGTKSGTLNYTLDNDLEYETGTYTTTFTYTLAVP